jgi:hypothetical protein
MLISAKYALTRVRSRLASGNVYVQLECVPRRVTSHWGKGYLREPFAYTSLLTEFVRQNTGRRVSRLNAFPINALFVSTVCRMRPVAELFPKNRGVSLIVGSPKACKRKLGTSSSLDSAPRSWFEEGRMGFEAEGGMSWSWDVTGFGRTCFMSLGWSPSACV